MERRKEEFKLRFEKHYSRLCQIAYSYVASPEDAEDIVQELFINVWDKKKDTLAEPDFAAYMTTAVKNSCISFLRKKTVGTVSIEDHPAAACELPYDPHENEQESTRAKVQAALAILPPKCREIFLLSKLKRLKYKEIAVVLNISEKTVENQMTKAIRLLRTHVASGSTLLTITIILILSILSN